MDKQTNKQKTKQNNNNNTTGNSYMYTVEPLIVEYIENLQEEDNLSIKDETAEFIVSKVTFIQKFHCN